MAANEQARLRTLRHDVMVSDSDIQHLLRAGFHKTLGARPMRGAVEQHLQDMVVKRVLNEGP
jgi:ATP-dependent Clp protease ATP-binding subunit ClpB